MRHRGRLSPGGLAALALAIAAWLAHTGPPSMAHSRAVLRLVLEEPAGPLETRYRLRFEYNDDGHPVPSTANVVVTGSGPGGAAIATEELTRVEGQPGLYEVLVGFPVPGDWVLVFTGSSPTAALEHRSTVAPVPTATSTSDTVPTTAPAPVAGGGGSGGVPVGAAAVGGAVAVGAAVAGWTRSIRRRR